MSIDIVFEAGSWPRECSDWAQKAKSVVDHVLDLNSQSELSILLTDDAHIERLNQQFRQKNQPTNVLSWPASNFARSPGQPPEPVDPPDEFLGDLAFGFETCAAEARVIGLRDHFIHLTIHGILHLLGYDHIDDADAALMQALEIEALSSLNITNPYEEFGNAG